MASSTLLFSTALTASGRLMVRETVAIDTFARRATSSIVMAGASFSEAIFTERSYAAGHGEHYNCFVSASN